ncbi:hypothetical protein AB4145_02155 [Vibrio splendidus]
MIKGRALDKLSYDNDGEEALTSIIEYFGIDYLESNSNHTLPTLWNRPDRLATVELYTLGKCLQQFSEENQKWLKSTIRKIKKENPRNTLGFFTEIFFFGVFSLFESKIHPAPGKNPGYDFSIDLVNGNSQVVSIKNIDASDSYAFFKSQSDLVRSTFVKALARKGYGLSLQIISDKTLTKPDFDKIIKFLSKGRFKLNQACQLDKSILLNFASLPSTEYAYSRQKVSHTIQIMSMPAKSEKLRYVKKIRQAVNNLNKNVETKNNQVKVVFMRMHEGANYKHMEQPIKELIDSEEIDCVICYQPTYVRNEHNQSHLNHCIKFEANAKYALNLGGADWFQLKIPIGSYSTEQAPLKLVDSITSKQTSIPDDSYVYQRGDLFTVAGADKEGTISHNEIGLLAPGIVRHAVILMNGSEFYIDPKISPKHEELSII